MKTIENIVEALRAQNTLYSSAAAEAISALQKPWESQLAAGMDGEKALEDMDTVISLLQRAKQDLGVMVFNKEVPTPALQPLNPNTSGNDYVLDTRSGHSSVWIDAHTKISVHINVAGDSVGVGLYPNHSLFATEEPLSSCHLSVSKATAAIRQMVGESRGKK